MTKRKLKKWGLLAMVTVSVSVILFLVIPNWVEIQIRKRLASHSEFETSYSSIHFSLLKGGYTIVGLLIKKRHTEDSIQFFQANSITTSLDLSSLVQLRLNSKLDIENPVVIFNKNITELDGIHALLHYEKQLSVLPVNDVTIANGEMLFHEKENERPTTIIEDIYAEITNIQNMRAVETITPCSLEASAKIYNGSVKLSMDLNPFSRTPLFNLRCQLTGLDMKEIAKSWKDQFTVDIDNGRLHLAIEAMAKNKRIQGYLKPMLTNLEVQRLSKFDISSLEKMVNNTDDIFIVSDTKVDSRETGGTHFEAAILNNATAHTWSATSFTLRNAFSNAVIQALHSAIKEQSAATRRSVDTTPSQALAEASGKKKEKKGFLKRLFGRKNKKKDSG